MLKFTEKRNAAHGTMLESLGNVYEKHFLLALWGEKKLHLMWICYIGLPEVL